MCVEVLKSVWDTSVLPIKIGLYQGLMLSLYLFVLIIVELTSNIQENVPWCMLLIDDRILINENKTRLNNKLESWRKILEGKGLKISRIKTKYIKYKFNENEMKM